MLRPAVLDDALDIYRLRNDKVSRQNSRTQGEFSYSEHQGWFKKRLDCKTGQFLIVEINDKFAGYVRFDDNVISIALTEEFRGKGLAREIIAAAMKETEGEVFAHIKKSNISSIKAFEGAGFELTGTDGEFGIYSCRA